MNFKVIYNNCYGEFGVSELALKEYNMRTNKNITHGRSIDRFDTTLIELVETLGEAVNDLHSELKIMEIPIKYRAFIDIEDYDGKQFVRINYNRYMIYHMNCIKDNNMMSSDEKMVAIQNLFNEYDARPKTIGDIWNKEKEEKYACV